MFWLVAMKPEEVMRDAEKSGIVLKDQALEDAIKNIQDSSRNSSKDFKNILKTFSQMIWKKTNDIVKELSMFTHRNDILSAVLAKFSEVVKKEIDVDRSPGEIVKYIAYAFNTKINKTYVKEYLDINVGVFSGMDKKFRAALSKFFKEHKRLPDFKKYTPNDVDDDIHIFARILLSIPEDTEVTQQNINTVDEYIKHYKQPELSIDKEVNKGDETGGTTTLGDMIKSDSPIPSDFLKNKELSKSIKNAIDSIKENTKEKTEQRKNVIKLFNGLFDYKEVFNELIKNIPEEKRSLYNVKDLTLEQITELTGAGRMARHWTSRDAMKEVLEEYVTNKQVEEAIHANILLMEKYAFFIRKSEEDMIFEIVKQ